MSDVTPICATTFGECPASSRPCYIIGLYALKEFHWLPIAERIESTEPVCLSLIGHIVLVYINRLLTAVADVPSRSALPDATKGNFVVPITHARRIRREGVLCCCSSSVEYQLRTELKTLRTIPLFERDFKNFPFPG